ncbi:MAG: hypothetical protein EXR78_07885 [Deltaproteobacteria bacterium]|nr:hypothetical protein [Deltaproteobacteria bacterium]
MRRSLFCVCMLLALGVSACSYPKQRWKELQKEAKRRIEDTKSPEEKCAKRDGTLYNGQCYTPNESGPEFTQEECRLRAGLYLDDHCLFPPSQGIVVEREPTEEMKSEE